MTLNEAINHCADKTDNTECGQNHKQLLEWLIELKILRQMTGIYEEKVRKCKCE